MKLILVISALASVSSASGAMAAEAILAKLQVASSTAAKPVAGGAVFECLGDVCASRAPASDTASVRACKELARQMGAVSSFGPASKPLDAAELASCNGAARK